ncbi:MAG: hypothetical protein FJ202_10305 [Gemmatimonadetes bacterium]|nr:hypothetical protein [Gemmatimonadota bacterium]
MSGARVVRVMSGILVAGLGIYASARLGIYAEQDDAPGGVVIAAILMIGSVVLGGWIARGRSATRFSFSVCRTRCSRR